MTTLSERAQQFAGTERPAGNLLDIEQVTAQAVAATRMYAAYGKLRAQDIVDNVPPIDADIAVTNSEWGVIRPLFMLYVERENALQLEASLAQINRLAVSLNSGYGNDSRFLRELDRFMPQLNEAVRSFRALTDLLSRHPEALIQGRTNKGRE